MNEENPTPTEEIIRFIGIRDLEPIEQDTVNKLSTEYYEKIKRELQNITSMVVHIKAQAKSDKNQDTRKRYTIRVRVEYPGQLLEGSVDNQWELPMAMHKVLTDVINQIRHRHHTDTTRPGAEHNRETAKRASGKRL